MIGRLVVLLAFFVVASAAYAGPYNPEDRWINRTLHSSDHWHDRRGLAVEYRRTHRPVRHRKRRHQPETHSRRPVLHYSSTIVRDATGAVECFPPIEARSHERQSESSAWDDAQRSWENTVRWKYGERMMNIQHARAIEKRCNVSTVSESVAGKIVETVRGAVTGDDNGRRWRCEIRAAPCMAPAEIDPDVKGDRK